MSTGQRTVFIRYGLVLYQTISIQNYLEPLLLIKSMCVSEGLFSLNLRRWLKRSFVWVALLGYLVMSFGSSGDFVLCIGPDGHLALEAAQNGLCADWHEPKTTEEASTPKQPVLRADDCKQCQDIPVSLHASQPQMETAQPMPGPMDIALLPSPPVEPVHGFLETATEGQLPKPPPQPPRLHIFLRTVVLII